MGWTVRSWHAADFTYIDDARQAAGHKSFLHLPGGATVWGD